ncbi:hypothetical protein [Shewanella fidelis]|uniref:Uncharacterized protein n=1 Tax=Shewanella fidelis TaxID=173509 RepID=A0AAW8NQF3_9GAMM|nr:hypothetical protein [Shewanella fidelis]MDR8524074.1 hypothetical protein [Shewanella fidelis]MDW4810621.1 hypothetical protein [Shewanella fidelis]MDW4814742.1 hypothetical protein [Shewanella fidelis]MDW4818832.1 hypothetical protein [Shewanella fidelis]MDW4823491.1 hypothetical protein [Shewanella fidelis]
MNNNLDLESAIAALDQYGYDKKHSSDLEQARNKAQMMKYIDSLDFNLRRLLILQEAVNELVENEKRLLAQHENIQTYKTKIINLSRQFNISYDEVLQIMKQQENS